MTAGEVQVRGIAFANLLEATRDLCGPEVAEALRGALGGAAGADVRADTLRTMGWYPVADLREAYVFLCAHVGDPELPRSIGRYGLSRHLPAYWRMFLRALSPGFILRRAGTVLRRYFLGAEVEVLEHWKGRARMRVWGLRGFDANLWADFHGAVIGALEAGGAQDVEIEARDGGQGDAHHAELAVRWREE
ncbi:MAG TPA: hypothetical protein RMH85_23070 [Polyangiaceae bacterium LLY-WYZ-15_(1-7)]|nr:hypothetical protein [Myxococcales bacterium]MAT26839.1 hypothetical protein [Sandaracinus sp.]HJK99850.1 hypothetical protein [Polyangiaceae bacterium LLY-WYZ-15_(1-7)]HJL11376.1 hypothetical protein [Polyangiaceae bacterium LLY-WYZ-15_(1-7)]